MLRYARMAEQDGEQAEVELLRKKLQASEEQRKKLRETIVSQGRRSHDLLLSVFLEGKVANVPAGCLQQSTQTPTCCCSLPHVSNA